MNIHPAFVHFPVAFLFMYSVLELAGLTPAKKLKHLVVIKNGCLLIGTTMALITLPTGEAAEQAIEATSPAIRSLVETHSLWATGTTWFFVGIFVVQAITEFENSLYAQQPRWQKLATFLKKLKPVTSFLTKPAIASLLALLGLTGMVVAAALGGAIVYGPDVDPTVKFIYGIVVGA